MKMKHILLIDDNPIDNYLSQEIIASQKITAKISAANSAIEALQYLRMLQKNREEFPDVLFLDIRMPIMDGFGFLEEYSKFPQDVIATSSIFMLTSSDDPNDIKRLTQNPLVKNYFTKPLNDEMLNEVGS